MVINTMNKMRPNDCTVILRFGVLLLWLSSRGRLLWGACCWAEGNIREKSCEDQDERALLFASESWPVRIELNLTELLILATGSTYYIKRVLLPTNFQVEFRQWRAPEGDGKESGDNCLSRYFPGSFLMGSSSTSRVPSSTFLSSCQVALPKALSCFGVW